MAPSAPQLRHIALIGFMGSGKSTVGRALAELTQREFVDLDSAISAAAGMSISQIFAQEGQAAFRARELAALQQTVAASASLVIATGGGTFLDAQARAALQTARCLFLRGSFESHWARLGPDDIAARPLLQGPDAKSRAAALLAARTPTYAQCQYHILSEARAVSDIVDDIVQVLHLQPPAPRLAVAGGKPRPLTITAAAGSYPVELRETAGSWLGEALAQRCSDGDVVIFTDTNVGPHHGQALQKHVQEHGRDCLLHTFAAGEESKSLAMAGQLYDVLLGASIRRGGLLVALGGGVVGDLTGFVASTYMRGIAYVQIPTTTLAAVDSSVGGKTAVNTHRGKNLVGTFYPPRAVLIAIQHLATQDPKGHACGLVEALKMAATHDRALFDLIQSQATALLNMQSDVLMQVIGRAIAIKAGVVSRDERESGERAVLNVGHTVGHAIEVGSRYTLQHGEAVALGMLAETEFAISQSLAAPEVLPALTQALTALKMPIDWRCAKIDREALELDKKRLGDEVVLPVIRDVGSYGLHAVPVTRLLGYIGQEAEPS